MEDLESQPQAVIPELEPVTEPEPESEPEPERASGHAPAQTVSIEEWMASSAPGPEEVPPRDSLADTQLLAVLEACVYVAEEPLMPAQIAAALNQDQERVRALLLQLVAEYERPEHGVSIREVAGGYKMATKPEHHEAVRSFVKSLKAPLKLSLPALETLAVIAYKQPVTTPEIMEIRGVQGGGVIKTLLDRKLITEAGRKNVIGKPILFKTTKEFLIQFGLKDLSELPSLKEFEEIRRMAMADSEIPAAAAPEPARPEADSRPAASAPDTLAAVVEIPVAEADATPQPVAPAPEAAADAPGAEAETAVPPETAVAGGKIAPVEGETATSAPEVDAAGEVPTVETETAPGSLPPAPEASVEAPASEAETTSVAAEPNAEPAVEVPAVETGTAPGSAVSTPVPTAAGGEIAPAETAPPAESQDR